MNKVHYVPKNWVCAAGNGDAVCGFMVVTFFGEKMTTRRKQVTCGNCKRTKLFRKVR